ncbi:MAG TPA: ABC transporter permease [Mycobacteriales bacterium]
MSTWNQITHYLNEYYTWNGKNGLPRETLTQLWLTFVAVLLAALVALPTGIALGHAKRGTRTVTVIADATRSVPTYGLLVLLAGIAVIGVGNQAAVIALAVFALAPILVNAQVGVGSVDPDAIEAARGMGMSGRQVLTRVELPLALPLLAAGLRTAGVQTCATATLAAFVGGGGLGAPINLGQAQASNGRGELIVGALAVIVLTIVVEVVLAALQAVLTPGTRTRSVLLRLRTGRAVATSA